MRNARQGAAILLLAGLPLACASRRQGKLPTLSDYSDGVSAFAESFLTDWKAGAADQTLYAPGFACASARSPLRPKVASGGYLVEEAESRITGW